MTFSRRIAVLLTGLFLSAALTHAQTQLGQPSLDEQKAQIWCAAIKFVYDDTGRPNLKSKLNCGGSLKQLENSIKADSQKVYSLLYQPLEGRGTMYKGLGSDKSRLQKLRDEIINKLKASPSRKGSPARMQAVDALAAQTALPGGDRAAVRRDQDARAGGGAAPDGRHAVRRGRARWRSLRLC